MKEFFQDMPWLHTPLHRHANFIAPLQPAGGLLGGSGEGVPKMSKLQALAAARKKKAQEQKSEDVGVEKPMAELKINGSSAQSTSDEAVPSKPARGFPIRKRKDSNPHEKLLKAPPPEREPEPSTPGSDIVAEDQAEPSAFASTMFGRASSPAKKPSSIFTMPYNVASTAVTKDPFAGPSPDDVVIAAQSQSKGVNSSAKVGNSKK